MTTLQITALAWVCLGLGTCLGFVVGRHWPRQGRPVGRDRSDLELGTREGDPGHAPPRPPPGRGSQ